MKEIVIKVSDELLSFVYRNGFVPNEKRNELNHAILQCVELPKGHGELKDAQAIVNSIANTNFYLSANNWHELMKAIKSVDTLVEADKENENERVSN